MHLTAVKECPNCSANLEDTFKFCPNCGQTIPIHRFNLPHIFHEIFHVITHADKGVLLLLKELAIRPGIVAREYILEGKRKKYFNPFTFLAIVVGLTLFVNSVIHPYTSSANLIQKAENRQYGTEQERQKSIGIAKRQQNFRTFLEKKNNLLIFLAIPVIAFIFWLFFFRTGINYAEHLVAHIFFTGFYALVVFVLLAPVLKLLPGFLSAAQLGLHLIYLAIAYYQFLAANRPIKLLKTALASLLAIMAWFTLSGGIGYLYIVYG